MTTKTLLIAALGVLALAACATREPMPFPTTDCYYPACVIDVQVVEEGGLKKLKISNDGNVRMGKRHRLAAIDWNLLTPGYEFRGNSIRPHSSPTTASASATSSGLWDRQLLAHGWWYNSISYTNLNTERVTLYYDITVYPERGTGGQPITVTRSIINDP